MPADAQAVPRRTAEANISDFFRNMDLADEVAAGRDSVNAVACARPNIAVDIDAGPVRNTGRDFGDHSAPAELAVRDLESLDVVWPVPVW